MKWQSLVSAATALVLCAVGQSAQAQSDVSAGDRSAANSDSGEIIVTARKRQETALKVPVIETILSAETLAKRQIVDIRGITQNVPGLQLGSGGFTIGTQVALRGVGTSSLDAGVEQSVALSIDGLQFTQGSTYDAGLFDMAQIEVLKGPQSLFYGKNVVGGVIAIRTADPGSEVEVIGRASYELEAHERRFEAIASGPLSDTFGVRVAGYYNKDDGYFFNKAASNMPPAAIAYGAKKPRDRAFINNGWFIRGTAVWKPSSDFSARLKINHGHSKELDLFSPLGGCPDGSAAPAAIQVLNPGLEYNNPKDNCAIDREVYLVDLDPAAFPGIRNGGTPFLEKDFTFGSAELSYRATPDISIASETAFSTTTLDGLINGVNSGYAGPSLYADNHFKRTEFTQEVRIESDFKDAPINFLIGGYYEKGKIANDIIVPGNTTQRLDLAQFGGSGSLPMSAILAAVAGQNRVKIESLSAFGQLRWKPVATLEIALGGRYTDEKRHFTGFNPVLKAAQVVPTSDLHSGKFSPELTVTFTPTDDLTVFGSLKRGYKSGNFIMTTPAITGKENSFGDERAQGGEIGFKARTADRAFSVNAAFYYYDYRGLQVGVNVPGANGVPTIQTINAGSARTYGIDFDLTYRPPTIENLSLHLAGEWNHARFTNFHGAQCTGGQTIADGCNESPIPTNLLPNPILPTTQRFNGQNLTGFPLPKAADWTFNGGFDYEMPVGSSTLAVGGNVQYSSKFLRNLGNRADFFQPSFAKFNATIALKGRDDAWEVAVIGNDLNNKFTAGNCTSYASKTGSTLLTSLSGAEVRNAAGLDGLACVTDPGRQVFIRLTLKPTALGH